MFSKVTKNFSRKSAGIFIYEENAEKIYDLDLRQKCIVLSPPQKKDYGYTAGFEDLFDNHWWLVQTD